MLWRRSFSPPSRILFEFVRLTKSMFDLSFFTVEKLPVRSLTADDASMSGKCTEHEGVFSRPPRQESRHFAT